MSIPPNEFDTPSDDHLAETGKMHPVSEPVPAWRRGIGAFSLIGAFALTIATALLLLNPAEDTSPVQDHTPETVATIETVTQETPSETSVVTLPTTESATSAPVNINALLLPTLAPENMSSLLNAPLERVDSQFTPNEFVRNLYDPFTIIEDRPRSEVVQYEVQSGDTYFTIAERFGLKPETLAWSNDRSIIGSLRPGVILNILPTDGAYRTINNRATIQEIANEFNVDPFVIIDSEYNDLFGSTPESILTSGMRIVVPGGEAETITWAAVVETRPSTSGSSNNSGSSVTVNEVNFEPGDPGSCGWTPNPGGGGGWINPLGGGYTWMRGFTSWHTGVDLAAPTGTPVYAANGGTVVFAGWNTYGYGYAIVIAHGPLMTLYAHLSGINARCQQQVSAGQLIGAVGSTGDSSGPHLHFEIRSNNIATDPTGYMPF